MYGEHVQESILSIWKMPSLAKTDRNFCMKKCSGFQISTSNEHELSFKWCLLQKLYLMWHRIMINMTIGQYLIIFPQGSLLSQASLMYSRRIATLEKEDTFDKIVPYILWIATSLDCRFPSCGLEITNPGSSSNATLNGRLSVKHWKRGCLKENWGLLLGFSSLCELFDQMRI